MENKNLKNTLMSEDFNVKSNDTSISHSRGKKVNV